MTSSENRRGMRMFPLFVDISGKNIVAVGGGKIAARRIKTLVEGGFGAFVTVISPEICPELESLMQQKDKNKLCWIKGGYDKSMIQNAWMVLACTDDEKLNRQICFDCREKGIIVNTASDSSLCDFHFPGIIIEDDSVIAFNCGGKDHGKIRNMKTQLKEWIETRRQKGATQDI